MNVLFLIGSDLYSYNMANEICLHFAKHHLHASFLVFKNESAFNPEKMLDEINELIFYERTLFSEVLLPYLNNHPNKGKYLSLEALAQQYGINYVRCSSIDSKSASSFILKQVEAWNIDVTISIRCIVKLDEQLINHFTRSNEHYLWNVHPGLLPQYRGIMPVFGAMFNQEAEHGITLLRVSAKLDAGTLIDSRTWPIDYSKSMMQNALDLIPAGVDLITSNVLRASKKEHLPTLIQNEAEKGFYSFPTAEELKLFESRGMSLYSKEGLIDVMKQNYLTENQEEVLNNLRNYVRSTCSE
ncbi:MAG: formyltransferase family protein [Legionella sp.]|uniref:formyltransferase family protein n=1 Tax=Legionella sp. TaxID=459 RepID=UPI00284F78CC|nr:formyltransferase family protein [Legionella sp.]